MRTGENNRDLTALEKKAGQKTARTVGRNLKLAINRTTTKRTGQLLKSSARAKMRYDALDRIDITAPHYAFKQHFGFEGIKSNGVKMHLKPTGLFNIVLNRSEKALEELATEIGYLRVEQVTSKIRW